MAVWADRSVHRPKERGPTPLESRTPPSGNPEYGETIVIEDSNSRSGDFLRPNSIHGRESFRLGECVVCDFTNTAHADTDLNVQQKSSGKNGSEGAAMG